MGNIQKVLQRYVGFDGINAEYCNRIEDLMDRARFFGSAHKAYCDHFKALGTLEWLGQTRSLQVPLGYKQEKHILPFSNFSHLSFGLILKNSLHFLIS